MRWQHLLILMVKRTLAEVHRAHTRAAPACRA
jgi:hypothetical protein